MVPRDYAFADDLDVLNGSFALVAEADRLDGELISYSEREAPDIRCNAG